MIKSEYKEASEQDNYWYDKSLLHRTDDDRGFERYDRPIGLNYLDDEDYDAMDDYEGMRHFKD